MHSLWLNTLRIALRYFVVAIWIHLQCWFQKQCSFSKFDDNICSICTPYIILNDKRVTEMAYFSPIQYNRGLPPEMIQNFVSTKYIIFYNHDRRDILVCMRQRYSAFPDNITPAIFLPTISYTLQTSLFVKMPSSLLPCTSFVHYTVLFLLAAIRHTLY